MLKFTKRQFKGLHEDSKLPKQPMIEFAHDHTDIPHPVPERFEIRQHVSDLSRTTVEKVRNHSKQIQK